MCAIDFSSRCGNGLVEAWEECDCGWDAGDCGEDTCCNPGSHRDAPCRLAQGARCR